ncbi:MAG: hypothetical protein K2Y32_10535 [Candidatus Obscuribacterales bacterium]|nr:hypothetical protein [Candidatus Obscuribacterales bacterium]
MGIERSKSCASADLFEKPEPVHHLLEQERSGNQAKPIQALATNHFRQMQTLPAKEKGSPEQLAEERLKRICCRS